MLLLMAAKCHVICAQALSLVGHDELLQQVCFWRVSALMAILTMHNGSQAQDGKIVIRQFLEEHAAAGYKCHAWQDGAGSMLVLPATAIAAA